MIAALWVYGAIGLVVFGFMLATPPNHRFWSNVMTSVALALLWPWSLLFVAFAVIEDEGGAK